MARPNPRPHPDPHYHNCPHCKVGKAAPTGYDTQNKRVYKCTDCGKPFGEYTLDRASHDRARKRLLED
jgi:transposase-like protein